MPECLTFAFHKRPHALPCGRCSACLAVAPIESPPPFIAPRHQPEPEEVAVPVVEVSGGEGGWYDIVVGGETVERVRGHDAAEARAAELSAE